MDITGYLKTRNDSNQKCRPNGELSLVNQVDKGAKTDLTIQMKTFSNYYTFPPKVLYYSVLHSCKELVYI